MAYHFTQNNSQSPFDGLQALNDWPHVISLISTIVVLFNYFTSTSRPPWCSLNTPGMLLLPAFVPVFPLLNVLLRDNCLANSLTSFQSLFKSHLANEASPDYSNADWNSTLSQTPLTQWSNVPFYHSIYLLLTHYIFYWFVIFIAYCFIPHLYPPMNLSSMRAIFFVHCCILALKTVIGK